MTAKNSIEQTLSSEILREVRHLHFEARHIVDSSVAGQYRSAFRGRGMEFEEVREYVPGDDVRTIDWKVTARSRKPFVKVFREERELTVVLAVDVSASTRTGTRGELRENLLAKVGAVLAFVALQNNDKVGLLAFSDHIELFYPPRRARSAAWRVLHTILAPRSRSGGTMLGEACSYLNRVLHHHAIVFLLSDFFDTDYEPALRVLSRRHDVTAVVVRDRMDYSLPPVGLIRVADPESGEESTLDCSHAGVREAFEASVRRAEEERQQTFHRLGIGAVEIRADEPFMPILRRYFDRRVTRRGHSFV